MADGNQTPPAGFSIPGLSLVFGTQEALKSSATPQTPRASPPLPAASINPTPSTHPSGWTAVNHPAPQASAGVPDSQQSNVPATGILNEELSNQQSDPESASNERATTSDASGVPAVLNDGETPHEEPESDQPASGTLPAELTTAEPETNKLVLSVPVASASAPVNRIQDDTSSGSEAEEPTTTTPSKALKSKSAALFSDYKAAQAAVEELPVPSYTEGCGWGTYPMPPEGESPNAHTGSPPAISTNGQTNPELWEDRRSRFEKNGIDQSDKLPLKLIDMRVDPKTKKPKRQPMYWTWGAPLNYNDNRTIKVINDRRKTNIERICCDAPWTEYERKILALLFEMYPEMSMREAAERWNYHFVNNITGGYVGNANSDDPEETQVVEPDAIRRCPRTLESIRAEYLENQEAYNVGQAPKIKKRPNDNKKGKKRKIESNCSDQDNGDDEDKPKVKRAKRKSTPAPPEHEEEKKEAEPEEEEKEEALAPESAFSPEDRLLMKKHVQTQLVAKAAKSIAESGKISKVARRLNWQQVMRAFNDCKKKNMSAAEVKKYKNVQYKALGAEFDKFEEQYRDPNFDISGDLIMRDAEDEDTPQENTTQTADVSQQDSDAATPASPATSSQGDELLALAGISASDFPSSSSPRRTTPSPPRPTTPIPEAARDYSISFHLAERRILKELNEEDAYAYEHFTKLADALNKRRRQEVPELKQKNRTRAEMEQHWTHFGYYYQQGEVPDESYDGWMPPVEAETEPTAVNAGEVEVNVEQTTSTAVVATATENETAVIAETVQETTTTSTTTATNATAVDPIPTTEGLSPEAIARVNARAVRIAQEAGVVGLLNMYGAQRDTRPVAILQIRAELEAEAAAAAAIQETEPVVEEAAMSSRVIEEYVEDEVDWSDGKVDEGEAEAELPKSWTEKQVDEEEEAEL
ncbi:hypothetical protein BU16DRAFT_545417 [Lophium mytilinum]|uniref:Uncharacterized protein n=1 Tax=Lophium mytilinum TaxID=390894 RepID=A0A6A6Q8T2_9PEZI|nr:hypothetical protein BU16DRAFT_545417 [Lophium mytilinum]